MIQVNIKEIEKKIFSLLSQVEQEKKEVKILRDGNEIAQIMPITSQKNQDSIFETKPELRVKMHEDPSLPLDPEDFPTVPKQ